ncbi:TerC/Alx family metal homeostasis membrane protein [uncultured Prevotella sp.]|uniref:TerC/Alx family metal homeostasis membrane protein n=1 Tax=uncultured Prevotella sp. TaxID=159272 RepID=UPI00260C3C51|nr:TerC/Alx family metal homeostasis membrane protein [uncultured Prevotella sp.]
MLTTELFFLVGFVVFIAAILVLDMLVIDRKAHVVSIKEAGTWTAVWIVLALAFAIFLYFHGDMVHGIQNFNDLQAVSTRYASHLKLNPDDFEASLQQYRHYMTISYISGYLIEKTLSVDNLFVMMMIFASFGIDKKEYQHALNWGILGAIVLRFVFIFAGAALISRFEWILLVFGVFLLYSGVKMFLDRNKKEEINAMNHPVVRFLNKHFHLTPLVLTVIFIEFCDLIFAFDSIPAVFSVTLDPYVVFFSNIFAILGLRALFFLLAAIADKFRYLKVGVSVLLVFIGVKMLVHEYIEIGAVSSLVFILLVLAVSICASIFIAPAKDK